MVKRKLLYSNALLTIPLAKHNRYLLSDIKQDQSHADEINFYIFRAPEMFNHNNDKTTAKTISNKLSPPFHTIPIIEANYNNILLTITSTNNQKIQNYITHSNPLPICKHYVHLATRLVPSGFLISKHRTLPSSLGITL